jgi:putative PIG3 family NAD(P)H quinone oxidoreductase
VVTDVPSPVPGPTDVLIEVAAAGVNRADLLQHAGHYPPPPGASPVLGLEVSGVVTAVGSQVHGWRAGDLVAALLAGGGYAEQVCAPASQLHPLPGSMDLSDAAALPEAAATAWVSLVGAGRLRSGDVVLVHGGSGGLGTFAIQVAAALGARVLTTAGGPGRTRRCLELGADVAIDHRSEDFVARVLEETDGRGADVVLDVMGADYLARNLSAVAVGGRIVVIGLQSGGRGELDLGSLLAKRASIIGTTLRSRPTAEKAAIVADVIRHVWPLLEAGTIRPVVHARVPLADAERAHEMLRTGEAFGKVLLIP